MSNTDETEWCCLRRYGFPLDEQKCQTCDDSDRCKRFTHLAFGRQIRSLTRRAVTILVGGHDQGTDKTSVVTLPIRDSKIFLSLLNFAGTKKQELAFLLDVSGNVIDFKTREEWEKLLKSC